MTSPASSPEEIERQRQNQSRVYRTRLDALWFGNQSWLSATLFQGNCRLERKSANDWEITTLSPSETVVSSPNPSTSPLRPCRPWFRLRFVPQTDDWTQIDELGGKLDIDAEYYDVRHKELILRWTHCLGQSGRLRIALNPYFDSWEMYPLAEGIAANAARVVSLIARLLERGVEFEFDPHPQNPITSSSSVFVFVTGVWLRLDCANQNLTEVRESHSPFTPPPLAMSPIDNKRYRFNPSQLLVKTRHEF